MTDGFMKSIERGWEREMRGKRDRADEKGASKVLASVHERLSARLNATWHVSASRDELEVTTTVGVLSIRVRRRNRTPGKGDRRLWRCTVWTKGAVQGLLVAEDRARDAVDALYGALDQVAKLWMGLGKALERRRP